MVTQSIALAKKPHIIIATPGRLVDHLENTKGFSLKTIRYLVMDEADRILNMDFEDDVDKMLKVIPKERVTYLYSATMTKKVKFNSENLEIFYEFFGMGRNIGLKN